MYFIYGFLKPQTKETIAITSQTIDALVQQQEELQQFPVSPEQRQEIVEGHVDDEVLVREAYKLNMDKNDFRVRKRILSIMRSSLSEVVPEPTYAELQKYYEENKLDYQSDTLWTFEHVYFAFNSERIPENSAFFLQDLSKSSDVNGMGDFSLMGNRVSRMSFRQISMNFGKSFATQVIDLPLNVWVGPLESNQGIHFVHLTAKADPEAPPFEQVEPYLRQDYLFRKSRESQQKKIQELRKPYEIVIADDMIDQ